MIDHRKVRQALRSAWVNSDVVPAERQCFENRPFSPPDPKGSGASWVRETYSVVDESKVASDLIGSHVMYTLDVFVPANTGTELADKLVKAISSVFPPASSVVLDGTEVAIDRCEPAGTGRVDQPWYFKTVYVHARTYSPLP